MDWMPTTAHIIYIPVILLLGFVGGWVMGSRATHNEIARQKEREEAREARRAERAARKAAREGGDGGDAAEA
jgi:hypothetical protein